MADLVAGDVTYTMSSGADAANQSDLMGSDVTGTKRNKVHRLTIAFGDGVDTYPSGGVPLTNSSMGIAESLLALRILENSAGTGINWKWDKSANTLRGYAGSGGSFTGTAPSGDALNILDADGAAAAGVLVYLHIDEVTEQGSYLGHLEFVSPTNADGTGTINNGGATYKIQDDDAAATGGVQLYFDEDGTNADERLMAVVPDAQDVFIMLSNGEMLRIFHDASAATNGVSVYFDEDAANTYERLQFVSPTDTDGVGATDDTVTMARDTPAGTLSGGTGGELSAGVDTVAAQTLEVEAVGY